MFDYKLQICCMVIVLFIEAAYVKDTWGDTRLKCNRYFDSILVVIPWAIFFDGFTAYTVNHRDVVPEVINLVAHLFFLLLMDALLILLFLFFLDITMTMKGRTQHTLFVFPGFISLVLVAATINKLYYVDGVHTSYSMGVPVYICFTSVFAHFMLILVLLVIKRRTIEKYKMFGIEVLMLMVAAILSIQIVFPEMLISSLIPTVTLLGIYINFTNPSISKLKVLSKDMISSFANLVESRDDSTGGHIKRTEAYVQVIVDAMRQDNSYNSVLTKDYMNSVSQAAPMHDIGKISTPDSILQKPGKLTNEEFDIMKQHTVVGGELIKSSFADMDDKQFIQIAYEVARYHHEKWNGKGYPEGLSGTDIPLHARIMAIADVFDAVSADRCYRPAMPIDKCFKIIEEGKGTDFDPDLVDKFLESRAMIEELYYRDKAKNKYPAH